MPDRPHFNIPFRFVEYGGSVKADVVEQDSEQEVMNCAETIVRFPLGYREEAPDFGLADVTFLPIEEVEEFVRMAIVEWEPRSDKIIIENDNVFEDFTAKVLARFKDTPATGGNVA